MVTKALFDPFPKYLQIREILLRRIERNMAVGDRLPPEHALGTEFGVSRETIREALTGLEKQGLISRRRGQGTFVLKLPPSRSERRLTGMAEDFSEFRMETEAEVLTRGPVALPPHAAELMKLRSDEMVYRILRRRRVDGQPFSVNDSFLPLEIGARVARLNLCHTSMVRELRYTLGLDITETEQRIEAVAADVEIAALLGVPPASPLLYLTRHFLLPDGYTAVLFQTHYRPDRYYYSVQLRQGGLKQGGRSGADPAQTSPRPDQASG
jgi:GntR family transcriptional regulator